MASTACHMLSVMVVNDLTQSCMWIAKGSASIYQSLVVFVDWGHPDADTEGITLSVWHQTTFRL
jgi:hypothetical protein